MPSPEQLIAAHASKHHGIVTDEEAARFGMSQDSIVQRVRSGEFLRLHPGVSRVAGHPQTWEGDQYALWQWAGKGAFVSGAGAGRLLGLDGCERASLEVSAPHGGSRPDVTVRRVRPEDANPRTRWVGPIRIACVERTLRDMSATEPPLRVGLAMDDALRKRLTTLDRLWQEVRASRGRKGVRVMRLLVEARDDRDEKVRSKFETKMLRILKTLPFKGLEANCRVESRAGHFFLDFAFADALVGIECHSVRWHLGTEKSKEDNARHRALVLLGWRVLYFDYDDVTWRPKVVAAEVTELLRAVLAGKMQMSRNRGENALLLDNV